jgi:hypothetical protein
VKNTKKTIMFHHEFLALLRLVPPDKAMMAISALCDIDLGVEPDIADPSVKALVEAKRESVLEERKKYDKAVERINKARGNKETPQDELSFGNEPETEVTDEVTDEVIVSSSSSSSSSPALYINPNDDDDESARAWKNKNSSSSLSDFKPENIPPEKPSPKQTSPPSAMGFGNFAAVWDIIRNAWNSHNCRYTADKILPHLSYAQRDRVIGSLATYTPDQMVRAIDKYFAERRVNPNGYEYKSFYLFVEKGIEFYVE